MVKKKLKKKSKKSPQKKQQKEEKCSLLEVSKELYEIQISDLNSKLKRLREEYNVLEIENLRLKNNFNRLDDDRADVIAHLEQVLKTKVQDILELDDQYKALQQVREKENSEFSSKLIDKENELKKVQEQLTTDINLLNRKLNVLDEFRVQKEDLMKKFQAHEETQKQQELHHQEILYNIEKDYILKKIHLKKEIEEKLIKLSEDFQLIMQSKIDTTTKITIAENNYLKNEMNKLMETGKEMIRENNELKDRERQLKIKYSLLKKELEECSRKYMRQNRKLHAVLAENKELQDISHFDPDLYEQKVRSLSESLEEYKINLRKQIDTNEELNKNITSYQLQENILHEKLSNALVHAEETENVIQNAVSAINQMLKTERKNTETNYLTRSMFVSSLLDILKNAKIGEAEIIIDKNPWIS